MVSVATVVADDSAEAARLALPHNLWAVRLRQGGRPGAVPTLAEAEAHPWTEGERAFATERNSQQAVGTREHVEARVSALVEATGANEVLVVPQGPDLDTRLHTLAELAA